MQYDGKSMMFNGLLRKKRPVDWKRYRIAKAGLAADLATKEAARKACEEAARTTVITKCSPGKPPETRRGGRHPGRKFDLLG